METPAQVHLIETVARLVREHSGGRPRFLNIGAGKSLYIEDRLVERDLEFTADRVDLAGCEVERDFVERCFQAPVENMPEVPNASYDLAFANYLLEHVEGLSAAAREIHRVLKPGGVFVASVPNPTAPEFVLAKHTPLWFHKMVRGYAVGEKYYSYRDIPHLARTFEATGFEALEVNQYSSVEDYLQRFPVLGALGRGYDRAITGLRWRRFMGNACLVFRKRG